MFERFKTIKNFVTEFVEENVENVFGEGPTANKRDLDKSKRVFSNNNAERRGSSDEENSDTQSALGDGPSSRASDGDGLVYPKESDRQKLELLIKGSTAKKKAESQNGSVQIRRVSSNRYQDSGSSDEEDLRPYANKHSGMGLTAPDSRNSSVRSSVVSSEGRITMVTESNISDIETLSAHSNEEAAVFAAAATVTASMASSKPLYENQSPESVKETTSYSSPNENGQHPNAADVAIATAELSGDLQHNKETLSGDQHGGCMGGVTNTPLSLHVNSKPLCHSSPLASPSDISESSSAAGHLLKTDLPQNNNTVLCRVEGESESTSVSNTTSSTHDKSELTTNTITKPKSQDLNMSESYVVIDSDLEGESKDWSSSDSDEVDFMSAIVHSKEGPLTLALKTDRKTQDFDKKSNRSQTGKSKSKSNFDSSNVSSKTLTNITNEIPEKSSESKILDTQATVIQVPGSNSDRSFPPKDKPLSIRDKVNMLLSRYSWAGEGERSSDESPGVNSSGRDLKIENTHQSSSGPENFENVPSNDSVPLKAIGDSSDGLVLSSGSGGGSTQECLDRKVQHTGTLGNGDHYGTGDRGVSALQHGENGQEVITWDHNATPISNHCKLNEHIEQSSNNLYNANVLNSFTETLDSDINENNNAAENELNIDSDNTNDKSPTTEKDPKIENTENHNDLENDDRESGSSSPPSDYTDLYGGLIDLEWDGEPLDGSEMTEEQRAEIVSQLKASMAFSANLRDFELENEFDNPPGYSSDYGRANHEGDFLDDDPGQLNSSGNAQTNSGSRASRYRQVVVPDDVCSDSLSVIAELSEPDDDEHPSIFIRHLHSPESEEEKVSSNDLHKTEATNVYENGDIQDQDNNSNKGESAPLDKNEIDDLINDINDKNIEYLTVISEKESESESKSDNEQEGFKPRKTLGSALAAKSAEWIAAENEQKSNKPCNDFVEAESKNQDNTNEIPVVVVYTCDKEDETCKQEDKETECEVAAIVAATVTVAESEPTPRETSPKKGKYPLEKADSLSNMIDEQDLAGDEDKDFAEIFESNKDYADDPEVKLEEVEKDNSVKVLVEKEVESQLDQKEIENQDEKENEANEKGNKKDFAPPVLALDLIQPEKEEENPPGASLEDVDESHLSPIAELQKKFDNPPKYFFPVVTNRVSEESNETEDNIKETELKETENNIKETESKETESTDKKDEKYEKYEAESKAVPIAAWMASQSQEKEDSENISEVKAVVQSEKVDEHSNLQMPDFAIDEEEKEPIDSLLIQGEFSRKPLPITDLDADSPVEEQELTPNGVEVPAEYQDEIDHADKKEENHIQEVKKDEVKEEKKEEKKDDNDIKKDAVIEDKESENQKVVDNDLKEKQEKDEDDLKTAAAIATVAAVKAADQSDSRPASKPATPKPERTGSKASDTSVPSISVTQAQSPSQDSIEPTEDGENIDEIFASHSSMNQSQTTDSQSLNKSNLLSPLSESKESITSFYSDAGEGHYGKIPVTGELQMALEYNYQNALFEIKIKQCKDLAAVDTKKKRTDPYVKTYLLPDRTKSGKRKTRVKKHTLNPIYDETIKYHIIKSELESRTLWVSVWHRDTFGRNAFLGEVNIPLDFYHFDNVEPKWYKLMERISLVSTNPGGKGKKSKGKKVFSSTPNLSTGGMSMVVYKGDLKLSLKYVTPDNVDRKRAKKSDKGEVHCLVKEARNLTAVRANGYSDPFCKAYLLPDKSKKSKQKSHVIKKNCNPEWNYEFIFDDVAMEDLKDRSLELTVWDHGAMSNDFLGGSRLNLGTGKLDQSQTEVDWLDAKGDEITVWQSMIDRPNTWVQGSLMLRANMDSKK